jgi:hypothetical protein
VRYIRLPYGRRLCQNYYNQSGGDYLHPLPTYAEVHHEGTLPMKIEDIKHGDTVVKGGVHPRVTGEVIEIEWNTVAVEWDDGTKGWFYDIDSLSLLE